MANQLNTKIFSVSLLTFVLLFSFSSMAEQGTAKESPGAEPGSENGEPIPKGEQQANEEPPVQEGSLAKTPRGENLKNRDLGAAFRTFRPSEEISADNAVAYPVDI